MVMFKAILYRSIQLDRYNWAPPKCDYWLSTFIFWKNRFISIAFIAFYSSDSCYSSVMLTNFKLIEGKLYSADYSCSIVNRWPLADERISILRASRRSIQSEEIKCGEFIGEPLLQFNWIVVDIKCFWHRSAQIGSNRLWSHIRWFTMCACWRQQNCETIENKKCTTIETTANGSDHFSR